MSAAKAFSAAVERKNAEALHSNRPGSAGTAAALKYDGGQTPPPANVSRHNLGPSSSTHRHLATFNESMKHMHQTWTLAARPPRARVHVPFISIQHCLVN